MRAVLFAVLAGVCWGLGEVAAKSVLHSKQVGPLAAIAVRSTVALPVLWALWWAIGTRLEQPFWKAEAGVLWKLVLGAGLLAGAGGAAFFYLAISYGEVSRVKPIAFSLAPAVGVIAAAYFLGEPLTARKIGALGLIIAGVVLLSSGGHAPGTQAKSPSPPTDRG
jgi:drug/metabolite transporter (DMT)-like permease